MRYGVWTAALVCIALAGCKPTGLAPELGAREIRPPQTGIYVGSLYYADEAPTGELGRPVSIESLCQVVDLRPFEVSNPTEGRVDAINIADRLSIDASASGISNALASVGLTGAFTSYFDYKMVNVTKYSIPATDADVVFEGLMSQKRCRASVASRTGSLAIYQVKAVYVGDIVFERKRGASLSADVELKLKAVQPKIAAALKREYSVGVTGRGVVFSFVPIPRNLTGS